MTVPPAFPSLSGSRRSSRRTGRDGLYEDVGRCCTKFARRYAARLRRQYGRFAETWHVDEVLVRIRRRQQYLQRTVDNDGNVIGILVQGDRNASAPVRFSFPSHQTAAY